MQINLDVLTHQMESWKFWLTFLSILIGTSITGYKGYQWVKGIREEDFPELKTDLKAVSTKIEETSAAQLRSTEFQTTALVRELSELRGLFYGAFNVSPHVLVPVRSKPKRKSAPKTTKKPAKRAARPRALAPAKK